MERVAWIGWKGLEYDFAYKTKAEILLARELSLYDVFNLGMGRDFLQETFHYETVVLCYILSLRPAHPLVGAALKKVELTGKWAASHLSTPENWRSRLVQTGARNIIAFGGKTEVAGAYLKFIPTYQLCASFADGVWFKKINGM